MIDRTASPLDPSLRSLITVRVSQLNGCAFCVDLNSATPLGRWQSSTLFNERERAARDYAEAMTLTRDEVKESHFRALRSYFSADAIVELTGLIASQNLSSRFNAALGVTSQGFCELLHSPIRRGEKSRGAP